jgi:Lipase (class 3).
MSKAKRIFICILSGLLATAIAAVVIVLVVNRSDSNVSKRRSSRQGGKNESVTPEQEPKNPTPTGNAMQGVAEAGQGRFAGMMQLMLESEQYAVTAHYTYDIGEGEQVTVTQECGQSGKEWYCRNTGSLSTGETLADESYLYDVADNVLYLIEDKLAVTMGDNKVETGGVFADILSFLRSGEGTLELVKTYAETLDGQEVTAEAYRYNLKDSDSSYAENDTANGHSGSGSADEEELPLVAYFSRDGYFIAFQVGSIVCYSKVEFEGDILRDRKTNVQIGEFGKMSYEDAKYLANQLANSDGPVVSHQRKRDGNGPSEAEIVSELWEAQKRFVEVCYDKVSVPNGSRSYLSEYYTSATVDKLLSKADKDPFYTEFIYDPYSLYYLRGTAAYYRIRRNSDSDYSIYVEGVMTDGYEWKTGTYVMEIHYRKEGGAWRFDGYLPMELCRENFRSGDANSMVYRIAHGGAAEQVIKKGDYAEYESEYIDGKQTKLWIDGILVEGDEIKIKFVNNEQREWGVCDEKHGYNYDCYVVDGFKILKNTIGEYSQLKDTVYQISFRQSWENAREDDFEYVYTFSDGSCCTALVRNQWREAEIPKQSNMVLILAGTDRATINEVMSQYGYECPEEFNFWRGYDLISGKNVLPVDLVFLIFDGKIVNECFNFNRTDWNNLRCGGIVNQGEKDTPNGYKKVKPEGNETEVRFSDISFIGNPDAYDADLALLGSLLSSAAYQGDGGKGQRIYDAYISLGFESERISLFSYPGHKNNEKNVPGINSEDEDVGFSIASRKQANGRYLVMITIRGSEGLKTEGMGSGWNKILDSYKYLSWSTPFPVMVAWQMVGLGEALGNLFTSRVGDYLLDIRIATEFTVQGVPTHKGFAIATADVAMGLKYYVDKHPELNDAAAEGMIDFFVTGHSLGGSVTNLLCATVLNGLQANGNKVYGYCMAPPKTIHFFEGYAIDGCDNIWNIVISDDFWGSTYPGDATGDFPTVWSRYGNDRYIPYTGNLDAHHSYSYIEGLLMEMKQ